MIGNIANGWGQRSTSTRSRREGYSTKIRKSSTALARDLRDGLKRAEKRRIGEEAVGDRSQLRKFLRRKRSTAGKLFDAHDVRRTGTVSRGDLRQILLGVGVVMSESEVRRALRADRPSKSTAVYETTGGRVAYEDNAEGYGAAYRREKKKHEGTTNKENAVGNSRQSLSMLRDQSNAEDAQAEMIATMRTSSEVAPLRHRLKRADGPIAGVLAPCDFVRVLRDFGASFDAQQEEALCEKYARGGGVEKQAAERRGVGRWKSHGWSDDSMKMALEESGPQRQMIEARMVDYEKFANDLERRADKDLTRSSNGELCPPQEEGAARRRAVRKIADAMDTEEQRDKWLGLFSSTAGEQPSSFRATVGAPHVAEAEALAALEALGVDLTESEKPEAMRLGGAGERDDGAVDVGRLAHSARVAATRSRQAEVQGREDLYKRHYSEHFEQRLRGRGRIQAPATSLLGYHLDNEDNSTYASSDSSFSRRRRAVSANRNPILQEDPQEGRSLAMVVTKRNRRMQVHSKRGLRERLAFERSTTAAREKAATTNFAETIGPDSTVNATQLGEVLGDLGAPLSMGDLDRILSLATNATCSLADPSLQRGRKTTTEVDQPCASVRALREALGGPPSVVETPRPNRVSSSPAPLPVELPADAAADLAIVEAMRVLAAEPSRTFQSSRETRNLTSGSSQDAARGFNEGQHAVWPDAFNPPRRGRGCGRRSDTHPWKLEDYDSSKPAPIYGAVKDRGVQEAHRVQAAPVIRRAHSEPPSRRDAKRTDRRLALFCEPRPTAVEVNISQRRAPMRRSNSLPRPLRHFVLNQSPHKDIMPTEPVQIPPTTSS